MAKKKQIKEEVSFQFEQEFDTTPLERLQEEKSPIALEIEKLRAIGFDNNRIAARLMINVQNIKDYD
jgi:DNA-binding NarL/FixJ family response regulator